MKNIPIGIFCYICNMNIFQLLFLCGIYNLLLAAFHISFWKVFKWNETLDKGSTANKYVIQIMNIQLIYLFLFMSIVYLFWPNELLNSTLGYWIMFGYAGFWIVRFIQQFIFLKIKGKFVIGLTLLFFIGSVIHLLPILL